MHFTIGITNLSHEKHLKNIGVVENRKYCVCVQNSAPNVNFSDTPTEGLAMAP